MARGNKGRSLGEMISTVCFYVVGIYFVFEGAVTRNEGSEPLRYILVYGLLVWPVCLVAPVS